MGQNNELIKLEEFVSKLRQGFRDMKAECTRLTATLEERNATIADLEAKLANRVSEREAINDRVNRLIEQIEELDLTGGEAVALSHHPVDDRQRNLFPLD